MSKTLHVASVLLFLGGWIVEGPIRAVDAADSTAAAARLATYRTPAGRTFFSLSLRPERTPPAAASHSVVVLFDSSASQTGPFRQQALAALDTLLKQLGGQDRVQLMAVDLEATPLTRTFVPPAGAEMRAAIAQLQQRAPLGATDMAAALGAAASRFDRSIR